MSGVKYRFQLSGSNELSWVEITRVKYISCCIDFIWTYQEKISFNFQVHDLTWLDLIGLDWLRTDGRTDGRGLVCRVGIGIEWEMGWGGVGWGGMVG